MKILAKNRRANFDYEITDHMTAGLVLSGDEVKSIKSGSVSLKGSFISLRENEAYLTNAHVTPYAHANSKDTLEPSRTRKLLLHHKQIEELIRHKQAGLSVVPTALLISGPFIKLELGIGRGKKRYDKRQVIKRRQTMRDVARQVKQ